MQVFIQNTTRQSISQSRVLEFVRCAAGVARFPNSYELSIALVSPRRMRQLNQVYRGKTKATNVLSFPYDDGHGEIVLCPSVIKPQAKAQRSSFQRELLYLVGHALLHLKGMDHEESERAALRMSAEEDKLMRLCCR